MEQVAFGKLKLGVEEFYDMTPREFHNALKGWEEEKRERYEFDRNMTHALILPHVKKNSLPRPQSLYKFHWEDIQSAGRARILPKEEAEAFKKLITERLKK